jgi:hypothetical protein
VSTFLWSSRPRIAKWDDMVYYTGVKDDGGEWPDDDKATGVVVTEAAVRLAGRLRVRVTVHKKIKQKTHILMSIYCKIS